MKEIDIIAAALDLATQKGAFSANQVVGVFDALGKVKGTLENFVAEQKARREPSLNQEPIPTQKEENDSTAQ